MTQQYDERASSAPENLGPILPPVGATARRRGQNIDAKLAPLCLVRMKEAERAEVEYDTLCRAVYRRKCGQQKQRHDVPTRPIGEVVQRAQEQAAESVVVRLANELCALRDALRGAKRTARRKKSPAPASLVARLYGQMDDLEPLLRAAAHKMELARKSARTSLV